MNAIEVDGVSKRFVIPHERQTTIAERLLRAFRPASGEVLHALNDLSLTIPQGEFVGVIGANGSGKSTLLKLIAGLLVPDQGAIFVNGSLTPLLELGLGFHQELSVRENAALYGMVLGYPRATLEQRVDEVIRFAGLERFQDAKLKSLSSGMLVRLAFSTALRADSQILLLDEVMAVGDAQFQRKCIDVFTELKREKRTIVLVSHDLSSVLHFCDRAFWLDKGTLAMSGDAVKVVQTYLAVSQNLGPGEAAVAGLNQAAGTRPGDGRLRITQAWLESTDGRRLDSVQAGQRVVLRMLATVNQDCEHPVFGLMLRQGPQVIYSTNSLLLERHRPASYAAGTRLDVRLAFTAALRTGFFLVDAAVAEAERGVVHDWVNNLLTITVEGSRAGEGFTDLGGSFECSVIEASSEDAGCGPDAAWRET